MGRKHIDATTNKEFRNDMYNVHIFFDYSMYKTIVVVITLQ